MRDRKNRPVRVGGLTVHIFDDELQIRERGDMTKHLRALDAKAQRLQALDVMIEDAVLALDEPRP